MLDAWTEARRDNARYYDQRFEGAAVIRPTAKEYAFHIFNQYSIMLENRDELRDYLSAKKVGTEIYYPLPLHLQECFKDLGYRVGDLPVSERCARQVLSLPIYPQLSEPEREYVADTVLEFINK
jgi:dTDP-4-amino-4,6-dideoxygalactose transaminase